MVLTKQYIEIVRKNNWERIRWKHSYISQKLRKYGRCCHAFRHIYITKKTSFVGDALKTITEAIGHSSTKITELYLIADINREKEIAEKCFDSNI